MFVALATCLKVVQVLLCNCDGEETFAPAGPFVGSQMSHEQQRRIFTRTAVHTLSPAETVTARDALFAMLDGQIVRGRTGAWRAEVVSIVAERDVTWVQIGPAQDPTTSVVLRLHDGQRPEQVLAALRDWTDTPEERRPTWISVGQES